MVKRVDSGVQIPAMPVISCVILGKLPNLPVLVSPSIKRGLQLLSYLFMLCED